MEYKHLNLFHHKFGSLLILKSNDQIQCHLYIFFIYLVKISLKSLNEAVINSKAYCYFDHCVQYVLYFFPSIFNNIMYISYLIVFTENLCVKKLYEIH